MPNKFDYTTRARAIALRFPKLNHISIQVNFWTVAFFLLNAIIYLTSLSFLTSYSLPITLSFTPSICNNYDKIFLVSHEIKDFTKLESEYSTESIGEINLRGKDKPVRVFSVEEKK